MPKPTKRTSEQLVKRAAFVPTTVNDESREVDIIWTTGAEGERCEWDGEVYLESLRVDETAVRMGRLNAGAPVLNTHQTYELENQIGVVVRAWIENGIGYATVKFSSRESVEPFWQDVKAGIVRNISVGYVVYAYERIAGQDGEPDKMIAVDWEPLELTFCPVPFDAGAQVRGGVSPRTFTANIIDRSPKGEPTMRTLKVIRAAVKAARQRVEAARELADETKITEAQAALEVVEQELETALDTLDEGTGDAADDVPVDEPVREVTDDENDPAEAEQRGATAERTRQAAIRTFGKRFQLPAERVEAVVARGLSVEASKLEFLAELTERQAKINPHVGGNSVTDLTKVREQMQSALLHRAAPSKHKLITGAEVFRSMRLVDMARESIEMQGGTVRGMSPERIAKTALNLVGHAEQRAVGMHSTSDFPNLLGSTINRSLRAAYEQVAPTWAPLGRQANFADFRARTSIALGEAARLDVVKEGGEYKYGTMGEEAAPIKPVKYGKIIALTWEAIVNDDLGAFDRIPAAFAASARQTESDLIWNLFLLNPNYIDGTPIFVAGHNNLGSAAAINLTSLNAARVAMRTQKGIDKKTFITVTPKYLVVGPAKEMEAQQFLSTNYVAAQNGNINVFAGTLELIVEPRITDNSWYLVGDGDTFEYGYLEGEGGLVTDTREGFEVDGLEVKARLVFGAGWVDYRYAYKNPGA